MRSFKKILEGVSFSEDIFNSYLTQDLNKLIDDMRKIDYEKNPKKWSRLNNKAKKEFERSRIIGVDFYGYLDSYIAWKNI